MREHVIRIITGIVALSVSTLAVALAWTSAQQRATTDGGKLLQACMAVVIVVLVHLLPTLLRRRHPLVLWPVWLLCLALAGLSHASWFYRAGESAAEERQASSAAARVVAQERSDIEQVIGTIKARPITVVAAQLSRATDPDRRNALSAELAEARRAAGLQDRLILLSQNTAGATQEHSGTPENSSVTVQERDVTLVMSVVSALLLEVLGALLWSSTFAGKDDATGLAQAHAAPEQAAVQQGVNFITPVLTRPMHAAVADVFDELADLRAAIDRGDCKKSVRGIRDFMGCGMDKASRLRKQLIDH